MILTGHAIKAAVRKGEVTLKPFDPQRINPNSYNYRLGDVLLVPGSNGSWQRLQIPSEGYVLQPGRVYLGSTLELIGSDRFVTLLLGRSSMGRLGLFLNVTADLGHIGSCSHWTLELKVVQPVRIYPEMTIGQVSFWTTDVEMASKYEGRYHLDLHPTPNRDHRVGHHAP